MPAKPITSWQKVITLMRQNLPFINPCWLFSLTLFSFTHLEAATTRICIRCPRDWGKADWSVACRILFLTFLKGWCSIFHFQVIRNVPWSQWPFKEAWEQTLPVKTEMKKEQYKSVFFTFITWSPTPFSSRSIFSFIFLLLMSQLQKTFLLPLHPLLVSAPVSFWCPLYHSCTPVQFHSHP